ncbi:MAG: PIG-L family deacetylase [Gemmatimonadota bacterium]|nr:PIG-L family deacetylase [Gemmatimonadota bacterium]
MKCGRIWIAVALSVVGAGPVVAAAAQQERSVVGTALRMRQLDGVKRVLMIAAHPDDEDTSLLAVLARGMGAETAYLSLSRGEGGQNLIGPRLREGLGVIRTGELVAARALDGGEQYFTRAFDFGYSKTLDEALELWPLDEVLRDVVHVVRKFRPHVIVSVFSGTPRDGHGQHQLAGVAAREAFDAAGDPERFPELAAHGVAPWQPSKLYQSMRFSPTEATVAVPTGVFDPLLGRSHFQLAMESRSQHRSQDMGSAQSMGPRTSALRLVASRVAGGAAPAPDANPAESTNTAPEGGIFAGIDTTLAGQLGDPLPAGWPADARDRLSRYREALSQAEGSFSVVRPDKAIIGLARAAGILQALLAEAPEGEGRHVLERRLDQVSETLLGAAGVVTDVRVGRDLLTPGESVVVDVAVWNGGPFDLSDVRPELLLPAVWDAAPTEESTLGRGSRFFRMQPPATPADGRIPAGTIARWSWRVAVPPDAAASTPYYLEEPRDGELYRWPANGDSWALPSTPPPVQARVMMKLSAPAPGEAPGEVQVAVTRVGDHVGVDQATGEYRKRVLVMPAINVAVDPPWMVWPADAGGVREVRVVVTNTSASGRSGSVRLEVPDGWGVEPGSAPFALEPDGASGSFTFAVTPQGVVEERPQMFKAVAREGSATPRDRFGMESVTQFVTEYDIIDHPHIPRSLMAREASVRVSVVPVAADTGRRVGYIMGSGDAGPLALRQIGMAVEELGEDRVRAGDFSDFDVLVLGVRAFETRPDLAAANEAVLDFARAGGTVIVQYNRYEFSAGGFAPYQVAINRPHDRVTDENAAVTILAPESPVFAGPNSVGPADFEGWVQERGLYFLSEWDERYTPVMEMADPGEDAKRGALLVAPVGDGLYVYTGLAFFRQFPAGVPGAYRLFANLVSLRAADWRRVP